MGWEVSKVRVKPWLGGRQEMDTWAGRGYTHKEFWGIHRVGVEVGVEQGLRSGGLGHPAGLGSAGVTVPMG